MRCTKTPLFEQGDVALPSLVSYYTSTYPCVFEFLLHARGGNVLHQAKINAFLLFASSCWIRTFSSSNAHWALRRVWSTDDCPYIRSRLTLRCALLHSRHKISSSMRVERLSFIFGLNLYHHWQVVPLPHSFAPSALLLVLLPNLQRVMVV